MDVHWRVLLDFAEGDHLARRSRQWLYRGVALIIKTSLKTRAKLRDAQVHPWGPLHMD